MTHLTLHISHWHSSSIILSSPVELDCHLLATLLISAASSCNHLVLAAAAAECCQDPSPLLCSRACYCCSLLVFPGKDNVQSDMSVTFNENESLCWGCSSGRPPLARGCVVFPRMLMCSTMVTWLLDSVFVLRYMKEKTVYSSCQNVWSSNNRW